MLLTNIVCSLNYSFDYDTVWAIFASFCLNFPCSQLSNILFYIKYTQSQIDLLKPTNTSTVVGIPIGPKCAPLIADLFLYCYERGFMSNLQKSKRFDLINKFNDTSRYLDDIFTIDNPEFAEHIPDIYPRDL